MTAVTIGPLVFAGDRLAAVAGIAAFLTAAFVLSLALDRRIASWASGALLAGLLAARLGHVALHYDAFAREPLRAFMVWQGGFSLAAGLAGLALFTGLTLRRPRGLAGAAVAVLVGLSVWAVTVRLVAPPPIAMPHAPLETLGGETFRLAARTGRPMVVNLWATWCPPCQREMPLLTETAAARDDIAFVIANQGEGGATVRRYLEKSGLSADHIALDRAMSLARHYGVPGYPATLFLAPDGTLAFSHFGEISPESLATALDRLSNGKT
ncbi:TlpA family protein disulfide reductase [Acuticoccus sp. M5D2P5]|uniref:TlpA disulfide reductase family protein n=1 Tax=Acuticoccus kalidii TaxID=2910977 RepID=UPI001F461F38|nr:TlpA disulfide reductase family protein [Acuticoccus kalidii]MCF3932940.1 TlpA family protein disulfide reductase [Acuticoccus kalidii]